jgi:hypothetical protein
MLTSLEEVKCGEREVHVKRNIANVKCGVMQLLACGVMKCGEVK